MSRSSSSSDCVKVSRLMTNQIGVEVGVIALNRPEALNAVNLDIVKQLHKHLKDFALDEQIELVVIKGNGPRAYCAGGDIKALHEAGSVQFLAHEYRLDEALYRYPKPVIHLMHGITMGGGMGLMASGALRLCSLDTEFAMPEVAIGFVPDVGYRHALSRYDLGLGAWLALTGARFSPYLAFKLGVVHGVLPFTDRNILTSKLYDQISSWSRKDGPMLDVILVWAQEQMSTIEQPFQAALEEFIPADILKWCELFYELPNVNWLDDLQDLSKRYASDHKHLFVPLDLDTCSPLSIAATSILLRRAQEQSLETVFNEDYWIAAKLYKKGDFQEGILAKVIERRKAQWLYSFDEIFTHGKPQAQFQKSLTPPDDIPRVIDKKLNWPKPDVHF